MGKSVKTMVRMMVIHCGSLMVAMTAACWLGACGTGEDSGQTEAGSAKTGPLTICTTFYPTEYFARRIGGDLVDVRCPVPDDEDPIFWMPDEAAIQRYQSAALIVLNGAGFAKWVDKVSLPQSRIVDTAQPLRAEFVRFENTVEHSHGKAGAHSHEGIDGHTWVDPVNAKVQAAEIRNALILRLPDKNAVLQANYESLASDLDALDSRLREIGGAGMPPLLCAHPAYNYIARRYGWNIQNLDLDPGTMPSDASIAAIAEILQGHPARWILWESDPLPETAARLERELGIRSITFSPCELLPANERQNGADYLSVMRGNLERLSVVRQ